MPGRLAAHAGHRNRRRDEMGGSDPTRHCPMDPADAALRVRLVLSSLRKTGRSDVTSGVASANVDHWVISTNATRPRGWQHSAPAGSHHSGTYQQPPSLGTGTHR